VNGFSPSGRSEPPLTPLVWYYLRNEKNARRQIPLFRLRTPGNEFYERAEQHAVNEHFENFEASLDAILLPLGIIARDSAERQRSFGVKGCTHFDVNFLKNGWRRSLAMPGPTPTSDSCGSAGELQIPRRQANWNDVLLESYRPG